jgi:preprotein translocase subunit SecG
MPLLLALNPVLSNLLMLLFIAVAVVMVLIILIQRPSGGGLSGAFGASSGGSGQTAFGAKTGDALTLMTIGTFVVFILTAIMLVYTSRPPAATPGQPTAEPVGEQLPAETTPPPSETVDPAMPDPDAAGEATPPTEPAGAPAVDPSETPASDPEPGS